jgi:hypothetical protein
MSKLVQPGDFCPHPECADAMIAVYGQVPEYASRGCPPTGKQPQPGWQYLQLVKHHDKHGHLVSIELRVIFGQPDEVVALFGKSTACIKRTHLTMRLFNGRRVRHTFGFAKDVDMCRASAANRRDSAPLNHSSGPARSARVFRRYV